MQMLDWINVALEEPVDPDENVYSLIFLTNDLSRSAKSVRGVCMSNGKSQYANYFGDVKQDILRLEQIPAFLVNLEVSVHRGITDWLNWLTVRAQGKTLYFAASDAFGWTADVLESLDKEFGLKTKIKFQLLDLKLMYSAWKNKTALNAEDNTKAVFAGVRQPAKKEGLAFIRSIFKLDIPGHFEGPCQRSIDSFYLCRHMLSLDIPEPE